VIGNERADRLAGKVTVESGQSMTQSDIMHALRQADPGSDPNMDSILP
jgi:hypothetical protein